MDMSEINLNKITNDELIDVYNRTKDIFSFTRCDLIWIDDASGGIWNHYDDHG